MSWNGSENKNAAPAPKKTVKAPPSKWRGIIALGVVVVGGLLAWLLIRPSDVERDDTAAKAPSKIAEVKPQITTNVVAEVKPEAPKKPEKIEKNKIYRDERGKVIFHPEFPVGSPANPIRLAPIDKPGNILPPKKLYDTYAENYIVGLMRTKPGMPVVKTALPNNFDEQFKARIADPVGIKDDDTEEDIAIRKDMVEFKREMAQLIAQGEKPSDVIIAERDKLDRLAETRKTMLREISDLRKSGADQSEIDLTIEAANKILEQKGIEKIKTPALLKMSARARAEEQSANDASDDH